MVRCSAWLRIDSTVLLTADQNLEFQQNLAKLSIAVILLVPTATASNRCGV
jgi:hypothetical protein